MATLIINDPELHKKIKTGAADIDEKMSDVVEDLINKNLDSYLAEKKEEKKNKKSN